MREGGSSAQWMPVWICATRRSSVSLPSSNQLTSVASLVWPAGVGLCHVADRARQREPVIFEAACATAQAHLVVVRILARDGAAARLVGVIPVLHVVLLGQPGRTRVADVVMAQEVLHLGRRVGV